MQSTRPLWRRRGEASRGGLSLTVSVTKRPGGPERGSGYHVAAIHRHHHARHERRRRRTQEHDRLRHIVRRAPALERRAFQDARGARGIFLQGLRQRRGDPPRRHRIDPDVRLGISDGKRLR
ncbi:hypothetical protein G6F35_018254 [Rhizopus arrhizus]|nr:hypothetical protein G6F35_018254 [Rhizopus arrhizus]